MVDLFALYWINCEDNIYESCKNKKNWENIKGWLKIL